MMLRIAFRNIPNKGLMLTEILVTEDEIFIKKQQYFAGIIICEKEYVFHLVEIGAAKYDWWGEQPDGGL